VREGERKGKGEGEKTGKKCEEGRGEGPVKSVKSMARKV